MTVEHSPVDELTTLLDEIESLAPTRAEAAGTRILLRGTDEEPVDDSLPVEEAVEEQYGDGDLPSAIPVADAPLSSFLKEQAGPLAAVDCGIVRLGETENGLVIALRAAIILEDRGQSRVVLFQTGPLYLHNQKKQELLHQVGTHLGKPDLLVEYEDPNALNPVIRRVRPGVAHDSHKYGDRFRNWLERLAQRIAVSAIENGVVLLDGALTLRTIDTPPTYLEDLAARASDKGNAIVAVSKQSLLQVQGRPLAFWLDDAPEQPCYRLLSQLMRREDSERVLGNAYAVRFSPLGPTFRMDIQAAAGQSDDEAIGMAYNSCLMRGGYPDILVRAHAHSYFTSPDVLQLQAQASTKYSLTPRPEASLTAIFAPFGGRFK
jgi:hypothetical protein